MEALYQETKKIIKTSKTPLCEEKRSDVSEESRLFGVSKGEREGRLPKCGNSDNSGEALEQIGIERKPIPIR
jgi:hypothetical protein